MPYGPMVIDFGVSQIFKGQMAQIVECLPDGSFSVSHLFQKSLNLLSIHYLRHPMPCRHPLEW